MPLLQRESRFARMTIDPMLPALERGGDMTENELRKRPEFAGLPFYDEADSRCDALRDTTERFTKRRTMFISRGCFKTFNVNLKGPFGIRR